MRVFGVIVIVQIIVTYFFQWRYIFLWDQLKTILRELRYLARIVARMLRKPDENMLVVPRNRARPIVFSRAMNFAPSKVAYYAIFRNVFEGKKTLIGADGNFHLAHNIPNQSQINFYVNK